MSQQSDYTRTVSLKLSEVLNDIGVNERMVQKRRRLVLLDETIKTSAYKLGGSNTSVYCFGSQSEGSTTLGLHSDTDYLICFNKLNVIQDWSEWQPGKENLLMIQDETTPPGYCLLQKLRGDEPLPLPTAFLEHLPNRHLTVRGGKVLLKNTVLKDHVVAGRVINGPAQSAQGGAGCADQDFVRAFHCQSWPVEARPWLVRHGIGRWPTEDMKRYCETTGCFLVAVSSKSGLNEDLEWRLSTSQAERCLMFSLTITQLRCYILLKMILKTFINTKSDGALSSFMCKTVLLHCIQNTHSSYWQPSNLLACLICCLKVLQNFVRQENCPHFIIPENNLMAGRISPRNKHQILEILQNIIQSQDSELLKIPIDDLGTRLQRKMSMDETFQYYRTQAEMCARISVVLLVTNACAVGYAHKLFLDDIMHEGNEMVQERLSDIVYTLTRSHGGMGCNSLEKSVCKLLKPSLCSSLGSVIAGHDIELTGNISLEALNLFSDGLNSDVSSGRLKLASALYCIGDMEKTEFVLRKTEEKYDLNTVESVCGCPCFKGMKNIKQEFMYKCDTGNEELIKHMTAFCVRFLRCEINCVPIELQYEMFRSTQEERLERDYLDCWMDWAVVDSLPFLYFLQYKTYGALHRAADQQRALTNLVTTTNTESNLHHRETALNLLGQCLEQENRHTDALRCYMISLNIRGRNNAASFLTHRLLG